MGNQPIGEAKLRFGHAGLNPAAPRPGPEATLIDDPPIASWPRPPPPRRSRRGGRFARLDKIAALHYSVASQLAPQSRRGDTYAPAGHGQDRWNPPACGDVLPRGQARSEPGLLPLECLTRLASDRARHRRPADSGLSLIH